MMTIHSAIKACVLRVCENRKLPDIARLYPPSENIPHRRDKKFGVIALTDGSCGFFFAGFGSTQSQLQQFNSQKQLDAPTISYLDWCNSNDPFEAAIGFGVLNAVSQHLLKTAHSHFDRASNPVGQLDIDSAQHVGMVGFFPPLVKTLTAQKIRLTIIEKDKKFLDRSGAFEMTSNISRVKDCDRVLITGSTLINHTLDEVIENCSRDAQTALIGPTASCLPDPLFERGIDVIGSTTVTDSKLLAELLETGEPWSGATSKYCISRENYPGIENLLTKT